MYSYSIEMNDDNVIDDPNVFLIIIVSNYCTDIPETFYSIPIRQTH